MVNNPSFGLNMSSAFALRGEARLFSETPSDYRQQYAGAILDTDANRKEAREFIETADILFVSSFASLSCLGLIGGEHWVKWLKKLIARGLDFIVFACGTTYFFSQRYYEGLADELT